MTILLHFLLQTVRRNFASDSIEETPLANACGQGDLEMAMLLINNGADINRVCAVSGSSSSLLAKTWLTIVLLVACCNQKSM